MRSKLLIKNTFINLVAQIVAVVSGLILSRLILINFGSETNGLISSITQFLNYICLLEAGVGGVARATLYKQLINKNILGISAIILAVEKFFQNIAKVFILYMIVLAGLFPVIIKSNFNYVYICSLVVIIGISTIVQYYFGITYQILLQADQRNYIINYIQIITIIVNTLIAVLLIHLGYGIHIVKFASAIIFVIRPVVFNFYVKKRYDLKDNVPPDDQAIAQRWSGLGHHIAYFLQSNTDIFVLTLFTNSLLVSVYTVYKYVISSLSSLVNSFTNSLEASFGNIYANNEIELLKRTLCLTEFVTCVLSTTVFSICAILVFPFISIYTRGVNDGNYYQPIFAFIFIINEWLTIIKSPSNNLVLAAGHYKQTQKFAYIELGVNVVLSIILIKPYGLSGIVFATLCSTLIRMVCFIQYLSKNIIKINLWEHYVRYILNAFIMLIVIMFYYNAKLSVPLGYSMWIFRAVIVTVVISFFVTLVNALLFRKDFREVCLYVKKF